ncbi:MAG: hypothetical protein UHW86_07705 [Spirochaetota bacterium]|nr:hypothetical protein [Spirochaetota bacterium]
MSKKIMKVLVTLATVVMIVSCTATTDENTNVLNTVTNEAVYYENASLSLAKLVAETYLIEHETINDWENTTLAEPYPLYNPATDVITYLEYPVIKDGKRKGYIMVTLKEDEPRVVEASENSEMTNYEALANKAGTADIKAIRFSFASFVAEDPTISRSGNRKVLAALGNIEHEIEIGEVSRSGSSYEEIVNNYKERVEKNGGFLDINKDVYEANKEWIAYRNGQRSRGDVSDADLSPIVTEIKNSSYLPIVDQFDVNTKTEKIELSGCVPTAGAIAIAYYAKRFNNKALFGGKLPPSSFVFKGGYLDAASDVNKEFIDIVMDLRSRLGMTGKSAITSDLPEAVAGYMKNKGFTSVGIKEDCKKEYSGKSWCCQDFVELERALHRSNPVFLSYLTDKKDDESGHCVVVYKAEIQRDWAGNFKECTYYINIGWQNNAFRSVTTWDYNIKYFVTLDVN